MSDEQIKGLEARIHRLERIVGRVYAALETPSSWSFGSSADISAAKMDAVSEGLPEFIQGVPFMAGEKVSHSTDIPECLADPKLGKRDAVSEGRRCSCVIDAGCEIHGIRQWNKDRERIHVLEAEIVGDHQKLRKAQGELDAANQHVKILQDSVAAGKKDAVSEGRTIDPFFVPGAARKPSDIARRCFNLINRLTTELEEANLHVKSMQAQLDSLADISASKKDAVSEGRKWRAGDKVITRGGEGGTISMVQENGSVSVVWDDDVGGGLSVWDGSDLRLVLPSEPSSESGKLMEKNDEV